MSQMLTEGEDVVVNGTDAAIGLGKPAAEVVMDSRGGDAPRSMQPTEKPRALEGVLAKIRARSEQESAPASQEEGQRSESEEDEAPAQEDGEPSDEQDADSSEESEGEVESGDEDAEDSEEAHPEPVKKDSADLAALRADLEAAKTEAAAARARLAQFDRGPTLDDRLSYVHDPISQVRSFIAKQLGVKHDDAQVDNELAWIQRELTVSAIGDSNLDSESRLKHLDAKAARRWEREQQARTVDQRVAADRDQRAAAVRYLASVHEASKSEFPLIALAAELDGRDPADIAFDVYLAARQQGLIDPNAPDAEAAREALRLTNQHYQRRAEKLRAFIPAPSQDTAPAKASAAGSKPGATLPAKSTGKAKSGHPAPRTLSAKQAAKAPVAKPPGYNPRITVVEIDPNDRDVRARRAREIADRRFGRR